MLDLELWAEWKIGSTFRCHWHCRPLTIAHLAWRGSEPVGRWWSSWLQNDNYTLLECTGAGLLWKNGRKHKFKLSISRLSLAGGTTLTQNLQSAAPSPVHSFCFPFVFLKKRPNCKVERENETVGAEFYPCWLVGRDRILRVGPNLR